MISEGHQNSHMAHVEVELEVDGRWIAEIPAIAGALAYGLSRQDAIANVESLASRIIADRLAHGEAIPEMNRRSMTPGA
jgi:predicted RNase H-like HicB family nuclease